MVATTTRWLELGTRTLAFAVAAVGLAIVWTAFLTSTQGERDRAAALQGERLLRSSAAVSNALGYLIGDSRLALELLVRHIADAAHEDPLRSSQFASLVQTIRNRSLDTPDLRGVRGDGALVLFGAPALSPPEFITDREFFSKQVPYPGVGFLIDAPRLDPETGTWNLVLSQPVPPHQGELAVVFVALASSRLDERIDPLVDTKVETVSLYQDDGSLLYRFPPTTDPSLVSGLPVIREIRSVRRLSGLLQGPELAAYQRVEKTNAWVVVTRPLAARGADWDRWFFGQLFWVSALTLVILGATALLLALLGRLETIRRAQENLARVDPLTGLLNRRAFLERCEQEQNRELRNRGALGLVLLDLDHFKSINDRFGHQEGDRALKAFAEVLVGTVRNSDTLARIGGEEFAVLLPAKEAEAVFETAERLRAAVETIALPEGYLTTSLGVALWNREESFDAWYQRADTALYRAKTGGRNRVESA